ncbi:MAG: hypothetical protein RLZZ127_2405 [Planctomycetota bacterium]|jgi:hypothetical protein
MPWVRKEHASPAAARRFIRDTPGQEPIVCGWGTQGRADTGAGAGGAEPLAASWTDGVLSAAGGIGPYWAYDEGAQALIGSGWDPSVAWPVAADAVAVVVDQAGQEVRVLVALGLGETGGGLPLTAVWSAGTLTVSGGVGPYRAWDVNGGIIDGAFTGAIPFTPSGDVVVAIDDQVGGRVTLFVSPPPPGACGALTAAEDSTYNPGGALDTIVRSPGTVGLGWINGAYRSDASAWVTRRGEGRSNGSYTGADQFPNGTLIEVSEYLRFSTGVPGAGCAPWWAEVDVTLTATIQRGTVTSNNFGQFETAGTPIIAAVDLSGASTIANIVVTSNEPEAPGAGLNSTFQPIGFRKNGSGNAELLIRPWSYPTLFESPRTVQLRVRYSGAALSGQEFRCNARVSARGAFYDGGWVRTMIMNNAFLTNVGLSGYVRLYPQRSVAP